MAKILNPIATRPGSLLYSSADTLQRGEVYLLGLNPGGDERQTIRESIAGLLHFKGNAYTDEDWSTPKRRYGAGGHPLQRNLSFLFAAMGWDLARTCASNLIFTRSVNQAGAEYPAVADICWPVHVEIMRIVQPRILLAFGNGSISPYAYLLTKHLQRTGAYPFEQTTPADHGDWRCKAFHTVLEGRQLRVLGLPHLSRYTIKGRPRVCDWIQEVTGEA
jgi:hypothetical protein